MSYKFYAYKELIHFTHRIKNKRDIIELLLNVLPLNNLSLVKNKEDTTIVIENKTKMQIFESEDSIHSFQFPFNVQQTDDEEFHIFIDGKIFPYEIDALVISILKKIFLTDNMLNSAFDIFFDNFLDTMAEYNKSNEEMNYFWKLTIFLLSFESEYIRLDHDPINESVDHPLNHIDLSFNQNTEIKIGLGARWKSCDFSDFILHNHVYYLNNTSQ